MPRSTSAPACCLKPTPFPSRTRSCPRSLTASTTLLLTILRIQRRSLPIVSPLSQHSPRAPLPAKWAEKNLILPWPVRQPYQPANIRCCLFASYNPDGSYSALPLYYTVFVFECQQPKEKFHATHKFHTLILCIWLKFLLRRHRKIAPVQAPGFFHWLLPEYAACPS